MELKLYSIHDAKAHAYNTPFLLQTDGQATRAFMDNVNNPEATTISEHPEDYTLFCVGTFDDQTGAITPQDPVSLGNGVQFKQDTLTNEQQTELGAITLELKLIKAKLEELDK